MGACVSHQHQRRRRRRNSQTINGFAGRNKPLNRTVCQPKWKSDVLITETQLRRKREEYWDTAPAFEGRKEIWDALRGTCYALEQNDIDLAQSILDCANISLPHGTLFDCYDELGTRYQLPIYVLSAPINLIESEQSSVDSRADFESAVNEIVPVDRERDDGDNVNCSVSSSSSSSSASSSSQSQRMNDDRHHPILRRLKKHRQKHKNPPTTSSVPLPAAASIEIPIKFRLSNGKEHRIYCKSNEKFRNIKKRLALLENGAIDSQIQRLFFGGQILRDRTTISETRLQRNFVVQVILHDIPTNCIDPQS